MSAEEPEPKSYPPKVTKLSGRELSIDSQTNARVFWLLRRYSSVAYIQRQYELCRGFLDGLEEVAKRSSPKSSSWYLDTLARLLPYRAAYEEGLKLLRGGFAAGYRKVLVGTEFSETILSRRFESGLYWEDFGYPYATPTQESTGLFAWAARAEEMGRRTRITLQAGWAYQRFEQMYIVDKSSPRFAPPPLPARSQTTVRPNDDLPASGVWVPVDIPNGCPNFLFQGPEVPDAMMAIKRMDWAGPGSPITDYEYGRVPSKWQPVWIDTRYAGGRHPDESEFLDETTADPPFPARHQGPAPEM